MKTLHSLFLIVSFFFAVSGIASETTTLVSGSFGVAWLDDSGIVHLYDGEKVTDPLPEARIYSILAADLLEEGTDQLVYLDDSRKALYVHRFKEQKTIGPFGHNIKTMAIGRCSADETFPSLFACTFGGDAFRWTKEIMGGGWHKIPGEFSQAARGRFDHRNGLDDFVVLSAGHAYFYSTKWQTYSKIVESKNIVAVLTGNFTASPGDEIAMIDKAGSVFLCQNKTLEDIGQKAKSLAVGRNPNGLDTLYVIDDAGNIVRHDRETKTWTKLTSGLVFSGLVVKNGSIPFAVSDENLYKITGDSAEKISLLPPTKFVLQHGGKVWARYRFDSVPFKPYVDELRTPSGKNALRDAPHDHLHHHGLMYGLRVGGCDFWGERDATFGKQVTLWGQLRRNIAGSEINWNTPDSKTLLKELRNIGVERGNRVTFLDWQSVLTAIGDTVLGGEGAGHYFGLGIRFDATMDKEGRFFNDTGKHDGEIVRGDERLTRCRWMAYTAKLSGEPVTLAVLDHPSNPIPMTAFTMGDAGKSFAYISATMNLHREPVKLKADQRFSFKYRVAVWDGETTPENVEKIYLDFVR